MERTILHLAIDSFPIQAERLRCPKLERRPIALVPAGSPRPRVVLISREAREAGITAGIPLVHARRLCGDLVALPLDRDFYGGIGESIFERLAPFAPVVEPGGGGRFFLDLTGVARTHSGTRERAVRAGRDVEASFRLHPTLGVAANKLVSRVAAQVVAPDGDLLDVSTGSEAFFLAPLSVSVLPAARGAAAAERLDLLNVRFVRQVQALSLAHLTGAFGGEGALLWSQARGVDPTPVRAPETRPRVMVDETLGQETNDSRALEVHVARLACELSAGLRARREGARGLALGVEYADGEEGRAQRTFADPLRSTTAIAVAASALLARAVTRRVRVRRLRLSAWSATAAAEQLTLWAPDIPETSLTSAIDRARARFGTEALVPATWMLHGLTLRASSRP
jgi:DNA polymerase-4